MIGSVVFLFVMLFTEHAARTICPFSSHTTVPRASTHK